MYKPLDAQEEPIRGISSEHTITPRTRHDNPGKGAFLRGKTCGCVALAILALVVVWQTRITYSDSLTTSQNSVWKANEQQEGDDEGEAPSESDPLVSLFSSNADPITKSTDLNASFGDDGGTVDDNDLDIAKSDLDSQLVKLYSPDKKLEGPIVACDENRTEAVKPGTFERAVLAADCGLGYNWKNSTARTRPRVIALFGNSFATGTFLLLSGCPLGKRCPWSPRCEIIQTLSAAQANRADVVVIFQNDARIVDKLGPPRKGQARVLYWREAFYADPSVGMQRKFDFGMGVHWQSMILNPQFFKTPAALLGGITYPRPQVIPFLPIRERPYFAMSAYSHCSPGSRRHIYIERLAEYLGNKRVHQYGRCGNLELPPPPIQNAAKVIASHKFYLSFENTIEDGYVTEKLLHLLAMPIIPVYFGSPRVFNITTIPSYIDVSDFSHPRYLADYLLYLGDNAEAYYEYHKWRTSPRYFHPSYLEMLAVKSPGVNELLPFRQRKIGGSFYPRACACCRLCDENYVEWAKQNREHFVQDRMDRFNIERKYFQGNFHGEPKQPITTMDKFALEHGQSLRDT